MKSRSWRDFLLPTIQAAVPTHWMIRHRERSSFRKNHTWSSSFFHLVHIIIIIFLIISSSNNIDDTTIMWWSTTHKNRIGVVAAAWTTSTTTARFRKGNYRHPSPSPLKSTTFGWRTTTRTSTTTSSSYHYHYSTYPFLESRLGSVSAAGGDGTNMDPNNTTTTTTPSLSLQNPMSLSQFAGIPYISTELAVLPSKDTTTTSTSIPFRVIFVLGGPGSGKGTQSSLLQEAHYPVAHVSVGELLRQAASAEIAAFLAQGQIVPVQISLQLLQQEMHQIRQQQGNQILFLVDGFPRNHDNLQGWCQYMRTNANVWAVLNYQCPLAVLEQRVMERAKESGRSDDNLESLRKRFQTFERETIPVLEELRQLSDATWKVNDLYGNQPLDKVWADTQTIVNQLIQNDVLTANQQLLAAVEEGNAEVYEHLCDSKIFAGKSVKEVMLEQEGGPSTGASILETISNASVDFVSGKHVLVSYNRQMGDIEVRETRAWVHEGKDGWQNVHFARIPVNKE